MFFFSVAGEVGGGGGSERLDKDDERLWVFLGVGFVRLACGGDGDGWGGGVMELYRC